MKTFIVKLIIFSSPIIILLIPIDLLLSENLKKSKISVSGEYLVWNDIYDGKIDGEIVIYGASRAAVHFNSEVLEDSLKRSCYNLGINGLEFWHQYLRHREFLKHNNPPEFIILSIDASTFAKGRNLYNEDQFLPYMYGNRNMIRYLKTVRSFDYFDYYFPLIRYNGRTVAMKQALKCMLDIENAEPVRVKGYMEMDRDWTGEFEDARAARGFLEIEVDSAAIRLFDDFLIECRNRDIKVIFVCTPEYIDGQLFVLNRDELIALIQEYADKYDILFLDYSDDEICSMKDYFYNTTHLNKAGVEIWEKTLIEDLKNTNNLHGIVKNDQINL